jgi:DNA-binding FadR family transcriptional regulator
VWRLVDPDSRGWQAALDPDPGFLRNLCEVRLAIEPTAAGFAAIRATAEELEVIDASLETRRHLAGTARSIDLDLDFHTAVVAASHNPLLCQLSATIRPPFRKALELTARFPAAVELDLEAHEHLLAALHHRDPVSARHAADQVVGLAMLAVEKVITSRSHS